MAHKIGDRIKEQASTSGTGAFTLAGALAGFDTFASALTADGDTTWYCAVNDTQWEIGLGTRTAAGVLARTTVLNSSNADALVDFSAPPAVFSTIPAAVFNSQREVLTAARTYYVRTDGSDNNDGLSNTAGGAFLTLQKASNVIERNLDLAGQAVTVQVGDGTYTSGVTLPNFTGGGTVTFLGNAAIPANVVISPTAESCFIADTNRIFAVNGFKLQTTASGSALVANGGGAITFYNIEFGPVGANHISADHGGRIEARTNYAISGGGGAHVAMSDVSSFIAGGVTITITNNPNFSLSFCYMRSCCVYEPFGSTFNGTATGKKYSIQNNSTVFVNGASANFLPGNVSGSASLGATYG